MFTFWISGILRGRFGPAHR